MEIKPDVQVNKDKEGNKSYFVGFKASLTFEEFGRLFKKYILRKKEFVIPPPKKTQDGQ